MHQVKKKKKSGLRRVNKWLNITLWCGFFLVLSLIVGIFYAIADGRIGYVPPVEQIENPIDRYASQVISADGVWLGSYSYSKDNRIFVKYSDLSPAIVHALIATEDNRFTKHSGIDIRGLARAIIKRVILNQLSGGGGSTITQQLAKQLFSPNAGNLMERFLQKPIEWVIAVRLEKYYTKEEIINLYLNKFDFLYNAVGIQSAARTYFNTTPKNLTIEQAATLIGMCKNPSYYNPRRYAERTQGRRNTVLRQMSKYGYLDPAVCDSLCQLPVVLIFKPTDHKEGLAPYFRIYMQQILDAKEPVRKDYPYSWQKQKFIEDSIAWETNPVYGWCRKNFKPNGEHYNLYTDGLKIFTTLDSRMQQYAEDAVKEHVVKYLQPQFFREKRNNRNAPFSFPSDMPVSDRTSIINSVLNGYVRFSERYRTLKNGGLSDEEIDKIFQTKTEMSVYSANGLIDTVMTPLDSIRYIKSFLQSSFMAMDARSGHVKAYVGGIDFATFQYDMVTTGRRQIGSTMKPFVYSLAMTEGFTPCHTLLHVEQTVPDENGIPWTPANSTTTTRYGERVTIAWGLQNSSNWVTAYLMRELSPYALERLLRSYGFKGPIEPVVAMCLGTPDISVAEMVSAYSVFTNKGIRLEPMYITHIEDNFGNTVASFIPQPFEVLDEDATFKVLNMLQSVVDHGTAAGLRARNIKAPMGGKTGTTQDHSDAWYIGFTPSLIAGCWVGGDNRYIHFETMDWGQGARAAMPVYAIFMNKVYGDKSLGYSEQETFDIPEEYIDPCSTRNNRRDNNNTERRRASGSDAFYN